MKYQKPSIWVFLVIMAAFVLMCRAPDTSCINDLKDCFGSLTTSTTPPSTCCNPLKAVLNSTHARCLCDLLNSPGLASGGNNNFTLTKASQLPERCGLSAACLVVVIPTSQSDSPPPSSIPSSSPPSSALPSSIPSSSHASGSWTGNLALILGLTSGFIIIIGVVIFSTCLLVKKGKKQARLINETASTPRTADCSSAEVSPHCASNTRIFSYKELERATNNFEAASVLGVGGFGQVFKGVLSDGTAVAIKKLTSGSRQGTKEFLVEIEMLSRLRHRNLVKLIGYYCSRDSLQLLLCYELVLNGSLETWLYGRRGTNNPLGWDARMKIALDAARGLAYLHEGSQPCIIHRDFKASNILLDNNFNAKVSDFGLARQGPEEGRSYLSTRVMGTFGYLAPEYAMTGHCHLKSDVYSYGVVLLELLTGKKPVDVSQPSNPENLVAWAGPIMRDDNRLEELADPKLGASYPKEDFVLVVKIAAACVAPEAKQRPMMGEIVHSLKMVQRVTKSPDTTAKTCIQYNITQPPITDEYDDPSFILTGR